MRPRVVICGSFHRDLPGLNRLYRELEATGVRILSPLSLAFDPSEEVVRSPSEIDFSVQELEKYHLRAIQEAEFIWLHAPNGYVGLSGAFELGFAQAHLKPVFSFQQPEDALLQGQVSRITSVFEALEVMRPGRTA